MTTCVDLRPATYTIHSGVEVGQWVAQRMHGTYLDGYSVAIGLMRNEQVVAGVLYEHWNGKSLVVHMAANHLTPRYLAAIFHYPYEVVGADKLIAPVCLANVYGINLVQHLGFRLEGTLANAHPDGHIKLYTLKKSQCRYLHPRYQARLERHDGQE